MCGVLWRNGTVPRQLIILSGGTQRGKKEVINQDHSVQHCLIKYWSLKGKLELLFTDKGHCTEVKAQTFCFYVCCVIAVCVLKYLLPQTCKGVVLLYISRSFTEFYWGGFCCRCNHWYKSLTWQSCKSVTVIWWQGCIHFMSEEANICQSRA